MIAPHEEYRRARRRKVTGAVAVTDAMTEQVIGKLGNISETGMLLIASAPLAEDALYQFTFRLDEGRGAEAIVEVGAHLLWIGPASAPGQSWAGFRFITVPEAHLDAIRAWIDAPGAQFA